MDDVIKFGKRSQSFFELSPFYFCTFVIGKKKWRTPIHYWVATYFKSSEDMMEIVRNMDTPDRALRVGAKYGLNSFSQIDSREIIYAMQERFNQNDNLRGILLSTGLSYLEYDGPGFLADQNRYGRLLMKMRDIYATE